MLSVGSLVDCFAPRAPQRSCGHVQSYEIDADAALLIRSNQAAIYWWHELGVPFGILLDAAGYSNSAREQHLDSFATIALPFFGDHVYRHPSFMTDNGCPVELSWDWGWDGCSPSVRYSMEPLCLFTESGLGKASRESAGLKFAAHLSTNFGVPLDIFRYFWNSLVLPPTATLERTARSETNDLSQFFAGFDFDNNKFTFKAYFLPALQAQEQGRPKYEVIKSVLERSPGWSTFAAPFATIDNFMRTSPLSSLLDAEIFSLDVLSASPSRYKLYVRCHRTTFASVREIASLGGRIASPALDQSLAKLHELWTALFRPASMDDDCELLMRAHRTAGILYYFEMCAGRPASTPKIYLPVRHYASNDAHVERTVSSFVAEQARVMNGNAPVRQFRTAINNICQAPSMESSRGLHTYIGCTLERGTVKLISYINPSFTHSD